MAERAEIVPGASFWFIHMQDTERWQHGIESKEECGMKSGCGCNNGVGGAAFALVLFILLVIILGAFI